jgi:hypothetical protein
MPWWFRRTILIPGLGLVTVMALDRQGWITLVAAVLLALISLFSSYDHVDIFRAASFDIPQQAGIPCIAPAVAAALAESKMASNYL